MARDSFQDYMPQTPIGWAAAFGAGYLALKLLQGRQAPETQQPRQGPVPQQAMIPPGPQMQYAPELKGTGAGIMGMGPNGIPIVALPSESANRTAQLSRFRPKPPPGIVPQDRGGIQVMNDGMAGSDGAQDGASFYSGESFGGSSEGGFGGENF